MANKLFVIQFERKLSIFTFHSRVVENGSSHINFEISFVHESMSPIISIVNY